MPSMAVNGIDLYYEETGSGPPVLLISALSGNTLDWDMLQPALATRFRIIAFDNRGAGRSSAPVGPYTTGQMADDAAALLEHLGIERAHVVGLSMGGMIAQELALAHPERIDRLILYATVARVRLALHGPWLSNWARAAERGVEANELVLSLMPWVFTAAFMTQQEQVEEALAMWISAPFQAPPQGIAAQAAACRTHDALERLPLITAPTLVLVGAEDILFPVSCAEELAEGIPGARLHVLERGGHIPHLEYPEAVEAALLKFLAA